MEDVLILVDRHDHAVGTGNKLQVHQDGALHRAFSIFVFDRRGRLLLQQRAVEKYHSGGLWTNTCCGHPCHGETDDVAAHRRLAEEMGFDCDLQEVAAITYHAQVSNNLIEHEYDHIYVGLFDGDPTPDPGEASNWVWVETPAVLKLIETQPDTFTAWFRKILHEAGDGCLELWKVQVQK
jgi:isopentenyl-diphosphate delta-isomerase